MLAWPRYQLILTREGSNEFRAILSRSATLVIVSLVSVTFLTILCLVNVLAFTCVVPAVFQMQRQRRTRFRKLPEVEAFIG